MTWACAAERMIPVIHPYVVCPEGKAHSADWWINEPEHGYLTPAKLLAITANGLSYEDAVSAKEIPANLERRDDQRGYLAFQRGLFRKQRYAYDLQMAPQ
jgi:hypothetical protein